MYIDRSGYIWFRRVINYLIFNELYIRIIYEILIVDFNGFCFGFFVWLLFIFWYNSISIVIGYKGF